MKNKTKLIVGFLLFPVGLLGMGIPLQLTIGIIIIIIALYLIIDTMIY